MNAMEIAHERARHVEGVVEAGPGWSAPAGALALAYDEVIVTWAYVSPLVAKYGISYWGAFDVLIKHLSNQRWASFRAYDWPDGCEPVLRRAAKAADRYLGRLAMDGAKHDVSLAELLRRAANLELSTPSELLYSLGIVVRPSQPTGLHDVLGRLVGVLRRYWPWP